MRCYQCLILTLIFGCIIFQDASCVARVRRSTNKNFRDPGTYIVHFEDNATDAELYHFAKQMIRRSNIREKFEAKIIAEYSNIRCLTVKLSEEALKWVKINGCTVLCHQHNTHNIILCYISTLE